MKKKLMKVADQAQEIAGEMSAYADLLTLMASSADDETATRVLGALEDAGFIDGEGRVQVEPSLNPALN